MIDDALLSVAAAAALLSVSERQVRELIRAGAIPYVNVGLATRAAYRLRPADIEAFIAERTTTCHRSALPTRRAIGPASRFEIIDFVAQRAQKPAARQKGGRKRSAPRSRPRA